MGKKIIISAGHGNGDPGACANGQAEADLTLWLRDAVALELRNRGVEVIEDGPDGKNLSLRDALALVKANPLAEAWEIHFNAGPPTAKGVEVLSPVKLRNKSQDLALAISTVLQTPLRGTQGWQPPNAGAHHRLAWCEAGGGIIEVEFITHPDAIKTYLAKRAIVAQVIAACLAT
jgi:N-acetylmuramoyl-L-alanine amidase